MEGGNRMNWFNIVKSTNPHSLYSKEEIKEMVKEVISHKRIYGNVPVKYYGNLEPLGNLRADYNLEYFNKQQNKMYNYWIKEIEFELDIEYAVGEFGIDSKENKPLFYIWVYTIDIRGGEMDNITPEGFERSDDLQNLKVAADFVEIYNQPNHRYKNLVATLGGFDKDALKELIEKWKDKIKFVKILEGLNL
jgi:hypothetical protein